MCLVMPGDGYGCMVTSNSTAPETPLLRGRKEEETDHEVCQKAGVRRVQKTCKQGDAAGSAVISGVFPALVTSSTVVPTLRPKRRRRLAVANRQTPHVRSMYSSIMLISVSALHCNTASGQS